MGNEHRRRITNGDEEDVHTDARPIYCWTQRPGATAGVKRRTNRRERRETQQVIDAELHDDLGLPAGTLARNHACKASPDGRHVMTETERRPCTIDWGTGKPTQDFVTWVCAHGCGKSDFTMEPRNDQ